MVWRVSSDKLHESALINFFGIENGTHLNLMKYYIHCSKLIKIMYIIY